MKLFSIISSLAICVALTVPTDSVAKDIYVSVDSTRDIKNAIGFVTAPNYIGKKPVIDFVRSGPSKVLLKFEITPEELKKKGVMVSGMGITVKDEVVFADVATPGFVAPLKKTCAVTPPPPANVREAQSLLISLLEVRAAQREILMDKIRLRLKKGKAKEYTSLEKVFGLDRPEEINYRLSPFELVERLARLKTALQTFKTFEEQEEAEYEIEF